MGDWIEWAGGPCPVAPDALVEIKLRHGDGEIWEREGAEEAGWFDSVGWWDGTAKYNRIISYRLAS